MSEKLSQFAVMVKPIGSACNLRCRYCYYLPVHVSGNQRMSHETLEKMIRNVIESSQGPTVSFVWHGGEPTLVGLDFYRETVDLQKKYLPEGWEAWNNLQTNGYDLDDEWCAFLRDNHFDVGLSIDGTKANHDWFRKDASGKDTYDRVRGSVLRLKEYGIHPDLLCTVTAHTVQDPIGIYEALRDLGTGWMQFIPVVNRAQDGTVLPESVTPEQYGDFLCQIFNRWIYHDLGKVNVQLFIELINVLAGGEASLCWLQETCGKVPVIEADGGVYSCDHFVREQYYLGTLDDPISDLITGEKQASFHIEKKEGLTGKCLSCPYLSLCHGGCPKDRFLVNENGEQGQYYLCEGLRQLFRVARGPMKRLVELNALHFPQQEIMQVLRQEEQQMWKGVGRNDPCPCGSGKKAKKCCLPRRP
ncbi:MAG: anaerobic sulfatase maturase [Oscillospiraceae bacterium]|nr:anaerobic sulfatase maturase [Oscillospiraceae bacterium]